MTKKTGLEAHYEWRGKIETGIKSKVSTMEELALAYTPGVAEACLAIKDDVSLSYELTGRWNTVAVITDGTAVLGLGDIGPEASMPVMEGKCVLFKEFGGVDAVPVCIRSKDADEIVRTVELLAGSFGGINLEDIKAPKCTEIEDRLKKLLDIPVFHDDQHGTAIVVLAAVINALKAAGKGRDARIVISGAGAAGAATAKLLHNDGFSDIVVCSSKGIVTEGALAAFSKNIRPGSLADAMKGADLFIGLSAPGIVTADMVRSMNDKSIVLALANPIPEIMPDEAEKGGACIIGTGRSDFKNQINNVLAFPGVFRGAFDVRAADINEEMKIAAAYALSALISDTELSPDYIIPQVFDKRVAKAVAKAVAEAAKRTGAAKILQQEGNHVN